MENFQNIPRNDITKLYGAIRSELNNLSVQDIRNTAAAAGIDVTRILSQSETSGRAGSRAEIMPSVDHLFGELNEESQITALCIMAERLVKNSSSLAEDVQLILGKHGYQYIDEAFVPVGVFDKREESFLPSNSASGIAQAHSRLISGDYSGAITSACGAVDNLMQAIYDAPAKSQRLKKQYISINKAVFS